MSRSARRVLAVCLLLAVAAVACDDGGRPGPPSETAARGAVTTAPGGELPAGYLDDTLDLIRQRAFYADRVDWPAVRVEARRRAGASASRTATYDAIRWVLSELDDRHSFLLTPEEARTLAAGQGLGFGLVALFPERVVVDVEPGGGAARAGVRVGDLVESVDDRPVEGDEVVRLPPAEVGSKPAQVVLVLRRQAGDGARRLRVTVEAAKAAAVRSPTARRLPSGAAVLELFGVVTGSGPDGVRYVDAAHDAIRRVATRRTCGWVVDLRRNTGGSLPPMLVAAGPILGGGNAVGYRGRDGTAIWWGYEDGALVIAGQPGGSLGASRPARLPRPPPVAVLTSRLTASAGEGVAMAFRGRPATRSFGEPTAGVPTGNAGHRLPDGAELYLTEGIGVDRTGRAHETRLRPDQPVATDWTRYATSADPVLEAATGWLAGRCGRRS